MIGRLSRTPSLASAAAAAPGRPGQVLFKPAGGQPLDVEFLDGKGKQVLNIGGLVLAYVGPIFLFIVLLNCNSFLRYYHPQAAGFMDVAAWLALLAVGYMALIKMRRRAHSKADPFLPRSLRDAEPSWYAFIAISCFVAIILAEALGSYNYFTNMKFLYGYLDLNTYTGVDPSGGGGQTYMDAGQVVFVNESRLELGRSMGFYDVTMYCVAPIVSGSEHPAIYDFWAVGTDCCSGHAADFHCGPFSDPDAHEGMRLLRDDQRSYFQLAVQQAESVYQIKANRPIFFHWTKNSGDEMADYRHRAFMHYMFWIFCYVGLHTFTTVLAALLYYPHLGKLM